MMDREQPGVNEIEVEGVGVPQNGRSELLENYDRISDGVFLRSYPVVHSHYT